MQEQITDSVTTKSDGSACRLLVCDDSSDERAALSQVLRQRGYEVDEAADGSSALLMLKRRSYDLLLLDLQMPGIDGFDVLAHTQKNLPQLGVAVLSGLPIEQIGEGIARLPSQELPPLLLKPVQISHLVQIIELQLAGELP